jgi:hypothetical protein
VLTFTLDPRRWWLVCAFGRNPLVRANDPVASLVAFAHSRLCQIRHAQWERELRCLLSDDGGRNNRSYG